MNKHIAHIGRKGNVAVPTAPEIDEAVTLIGDLVKKYTLLITSVDLKLGISVNFDWAAVFTVPWIAPTT